MIQEGEGDRRAAPAGTRADRERRSTRVALESCRCGSLLLLAAAPSVARRAVHGRHPGGRDRLRAGELRHLEQVPARDHGRRGGALRLRQRRPARRLLHERREARGPHAARARRPTSRTAGSGTGSTTRTRTAPSPTSRRRPASPGCRRTATAWASAVGDYDNDGCPDLYVTSYGGNTLYRNNGDGTFSDVTAKAGVGGSGWSASAGFFDYDNDGRLDLFVTRYVDVELRGERLLRREEARLPRLLPPRQLRGRRTSLLYRNNGDGTFTRRLREGGPRRGAAARRSASRSPTTTTTASWTSTWRTTPCSRSSSTTTATGRSARSACSSAWASTRTARPSRAWAWTSPTTTTTAGPTSSSPTSRTSATACSTRAATAASRTPPTAPAWARPRSPSRAGARASSTTTTTAGRTSSSPRGT